MVTTGPGMPGNAASFFRWMVMESSGAMSGMMAGLGGGPALSE
jgi:hypothetical protein